MTQLSCEVSVGHLNENELASLFIWELKSILEVGPPQKSVFAMQLHFVC